MPVNKNAAIGFIFITLLIDVIGFGIIIPVMPALISHLKDLKGDMSLASHYGSILTFAFAGMQFLFAPLVGGLSDKYGRRPVLLFSLLGFGIDYVFMALAPTYEWLLVGRIIAGITGASIITGMAYIADISAPQDRAKNFGMVGAAFGLGFIVGPMLGGLLGKFGPRIPFYAAAGLALLNWLYGYFVLPESLAKENRRELNLKRANPLGTLLNLRKYPAIGWLIVAALLVYIASHAIQSNWTYYVIFRFNWNETMVGISLGVVGALVLLVQGVLPRFLVAKIGNEKSIYIGLLFYAMGMFLFGIATSTWMMFAFLMPYCLGGIAQPSLQAVMAGQVPPNAQGELQGAIASLQSLAAIAGPLVMNNLFAHFSEGKPTDYIWASAPFFLGTLLMFGAFIIAYRTLQVKKRLA